MSKKIEKKRQQWGGARKGAGHPKTGVNKTKICVSVDESNWNTAVKRSKKKPSGLVDWLVSSYVNAGDSTAK